MLLTASVDTRKNINRLSRRVDSLEESVRRLESGASVMNMKTGRCVNGFEGSRLDSRRLHRRQVRCPLGEAEVWKGHSLNG